MIMKINSAGKIRKNILLRLVIETNRPMSTM